MALRRTPTGSFTSKSLLEKTGIYTDIVRFVMTGRSKTWIAERLKIKVSTLVKLMSDPDFTQIYNTIEEDTLQSTVREMNTIFIAATKRLKDIIKEGDDHVALKAIDMVYKLNEQRYNTHSNGNGNSLSYIAGSTMNGMSEEEAKSVRRLLTDK